MKTFAVEIPEIWKRCFVVEASSEEEALKKAKDLLEEGEEEDSLDYSDTLDTDEWYVQDISNQIKELK